VSEPTTEYLLAKATLCRDLAIKQMSEGEGEQATRNLMRMVKALGEVGIIIEREDKEMEEESMSWGELAEFQTHALHVEKFNWCGCEEQEYFPFDDCPREGESNE
jgi:hypothetical protein